MNSDGPMNLGSKDQILHVKRDTIESVLVALGMGRPAHEPAERRIEREQRRLRQILRSGGEA